MDQTAFLLQFDIPIQVFGYLLLIFLQTPKNRDIIDMPTNIAIDHAFRLDVERRNFINVTSLSPDVVFRNVIFTLEVILNEYSRQHVMIPLGLIAMLRF